MGIGVSVFLIAAGAVLAFAVNAVVPHVDLVTVGVILMVAGAIGLIMSLTLWGPRRRVAGATYVTEERTAPVVERTVVRETDRSAY
ncbi:hypothetical protein acdb102_18870 [Acidothermaceae bacterium B102]|nr:hypothetical protein acdb102_18870 [Acidothermaceae bacterium B102]